MARDLTQDPPEAREMVESRVDGIPRLIYLGRILRLCFFPVATVVLGNIVVWTVPQAQEALLAFGDGPRFASQAVAFELGYIAWMLSAWYVARLLVGKRFEPDLVGACSSPRFSRRVVMYLPRVLAVAAGLPVALFQIVSGPLRGLGIVSVLACAIVFAGLVFRRDWGRRHHQKWVANWTCRGEEATERFDGLAGSAWAFILTLFGISLLLWLALPIGLERAARPLGAAALLMFALMSWNIFGGFVLTYLPRSYHMPTASWVPLLALLAFYRVNENHPVAPPSAVANPRPGAPLDTVFVDWLHRRANPRAPVIFIASAGGASRAAYWTTSALGKLEDEARGRSRVFAGNTFVISGVSGGSLGAASFVTTLDLVGHSDSSAECRGQVRKTANSFTGEDHLATVVGLMLFPDLLQRFLPWPVTAWDRSRGLEEVWARDWQKVMEQCSPAGAHRPNPWSAAFTALYAGSRTGGSASTVLPALLLNSTALEAGQAVLQANFRLPREDTFDLLSCDFATGSLTLAQAVHNSARFPYVSPAGVVSKASPDAPPCAAGSHPGQVWDRLGDGGYVEASGTLALAQVIQALADARLIRAREEASDGRSFITWDQVRVLVVDNTPTNGNSYLCETRAAADPATPRSGHAQNIPQTAGSPWPPGPDFLSPLVGAFSTRGGRGVSAASDLRALVGGCTQQFAELRLPKPPAGEREPSMNWMLDSASRRQIDLALDNAAAPSRPAARMDPNVLLQQNLDLVRTWFAD
jgi:hypothetical protein